MENTVSNRYSAYNCPATAYHSMDLLSEPSQFIRLSRLHCQQWKAFFASQKQERLTLGIKHKQEYADLLAANATWQQKADLLKQQTLALWEFRISSENKRLSLIAEQQREVVALAYIGQPGTQLLYKPRVNALLLH